MTATDTTVAQAKAIDALTHAEIEVKSLSPEFLAASDARTYNIIEDTLLNYSYKVDMTDDLVIDIQSYLKFADADSKENLALTAYSAKLDGVWRICQQIKNSPEFIKLVKLNTPDQDIPDKISAAAYVKGEVIATGTTSEVKPETPKPAKGSKGSKGKPKPANVLPMPVIASVEALEAMTRKELGDAIRALNANVPTTVKANSANDLMREMLAKAVLGIKDYTSAPKGSKPTLPTMPLPEINSIEELEVLASDRKALVQAVKLLKFRNPDITLRANAATVDLTKLLAKEILGVDYTPVAKASKSKAKASIDLPEGLSWEEVKGMKYRQLQQICKALKSQGLFSGNVGGKGATTENLLKGCADYFRSKGETIVEVKMSPSNEI
jgi:hypothetical protein